VLDELKLLVRLQVIDTDLMDIESEKGDLPQQLATLNRDIVSHNEVLREKDRELTEIATNIKVEESNIDSAKDRLKKSQTTIFSVKTTREYDAISTEIEQAKHQIMDSEKRIFDLLARQEEGKRTRLQAESKLAVIEEEYKEKQADMQERMEQNEDVELHLHHERDKIIVRLKKPVYAHYERIRKIRDGIGVSQLENGACSYCFSMVPPQRQTEVKRMDDLILCEVCGCILVWTDSKS
jgi:predicted  nucleic acid-binding Zn-ribbon protein